MGAIEDITVKETPDIVTDIPEDISKIFPGVKLELIKAWPTWSEKPTNYIIRVTKNSNDGKTTSCVIKYFIPEAVKDWEKQCAMQWEFNYFTTPGEGKSNNWEIFSWAKIRRKGNTPAGWFFYEMEDLNESMEKVYCAEETIDYLINLWKQYRGIFDRFEQYSWGTVTTKSNQIIQRLFSILQPKTSIESNPQIQKVCNGVRKTLLSVLKPASKFAIKKKYFNNVNHRISNGWNTVRGYVEFNMEEINNCLKELLLKVKNFDFEYNFWRLFRDHIFSDGNWLFKIIDFDNVGYQIKWTELIGLMWSNLLLSTRKYDSYEEWKKDYDERYKKLVNIYKDEDLIRCLLFSKLIWTIFQDNGYLIYEREIWGWSKEYKNGIEEEKEMMNVKLKKEIELWEWKIEAKDLLEWLSKGWEAEFVDKKWIDVQKKSKQLVAIDIAMWKKKKRIEVIVEVWEKVKLKEKDKLEEIKNWIEWNYKALQELMNYTISQESKAA